MFVLYFYSVGHILTWTWLWSAEFSQISVPLYFHGTLLNRRALIQLAWKHFTGKQRGQRREAHVCSFPQLARHVCTVCILLRRCVLHVSSKKKRWSRKGIPGTVKPRTIKYPSEGNQLGMLFDTRDSASLFGFHVLQTGTAPWIASNLAVITTIRLATVAENETSGGSEINVAPLNKVLSSNKKAPAHVMSFKHFTRLHNCNGILKNLSPCQANKF